MKNSYKKKNKYVCGEEDIMVKIICDSCGHAKWVYFVTVDMYYPEIKNKKFTRKHNLCHLCYMKRLGDLKISERLE